MKLLIISQKMAKNDLILGFFHHWVEEFSKYFEKITVICLEESEHNLPENVKVFSLGKEKDNLQFTIYNLQSIFNSKIFKRIKYLFRFYKYIWLERKSYDAVFVHMNQEYVLLAWDFWKLWGKKIYLWRNHAKGSFLTRLAVFVSDKVFCTSPSSYTARFKKTKLMPVGIDTDFFKPDSSVPKIPNSILFLGRVSPVKRVLEFVEWFNVQDTKFTATVAGSSLPQDRGYENLVRSRASGRIKFINSVTQEQALELYRVHEIYVNKTLKGSFDKTIFEAAACGMKIKVDNEDLKNVESKNPEELRNFVIKNHSLNLLTKKLTQEIV